MVDFDSPEFDPPEFCLFWILDEAGQPAPCPDVFAWSLWMERAMKEDLRRVAEDVISGVTVSTVFLGLPTCSNKFSEQGNDFFFETMVFGDEGFLRYLNETSKEDIQSIFGAFCGVVDIQVRYRTRTEAEAGHKEMVSYVRRRLAEQN